MITGKKQFVWVYVGFVPALCVFTALAAWMVRDSTYRFVYQYAEVIGPVCLVAIGLLARPNLLPANKRPWTWVPPDGRWWEYLVFGVTASSVGILSLIIAGGAVVVLSMVLPFKLLTVYVFGSHASLTSAV